jgi:DNA invertase Pin-like site-specific DNA recombinase
MERQKRNRQIIRAYRKGMKVTAIALLHGLTRQQVHNILREYKKLNFFQRLFY